MKKAELERLTRLVVQNVLRLENIAKDIALSASKDLQDVYRTIIQQLLDLPPGGIEREMAYQALEEMMRASLEPPGVRLKSEILSELQKEAPEQVRWASRYVQLEATLEPSVMRRMAVNAVSDVRMLNKSVEELAAPFVTSQWRKIDKTIRQGYLEGKTNPQVARALSKTYKRSYLEMRALTRTAVMSLAQQAHNQFWDANDDLIVAWRWDASMDYKVCPFCAPLDGVEHSRRQAFEEEPPKHPNCRCHIVPVTELMREVEAVDEGERSIQELVREEDLPKLPGESTKAFLMRHREERMERDEDLTVRYFMQGVKVNNKTYYRRVTDVPSEDGKAMTMGGFLQRANRLTQEAILGKSRAASFRRMIQGTAGSRDPMSAEEALVRVTK